MEFVEGHEKNGFAGYCCSNKSDENNKPEDVISFNEFVHRIHSTIKDTKDTIYT